MVLKCRYSGVKAWIGTIGVNRVYIDERAAFGVRKYRGIVVYCGIKMRMKSREVRTEIIRFIGVLQSGYLVNLGRTTLGLSYEDILRSAATCL